MIETFEINSSYFVVGHNIPDLLAGILELLPLDTYVPQPVSFALIFAWSELKPSHVKSERM